MQNSKIYNTIKYWPQSKILKGTPKIIIVVMKPKLLKYNTYLYLLIFRGTFEYVLMELWHCYVAVIIHKIYAIPVEYNSIILLYIPTINI